MTASSLSPVATRISMPARLRSAIVSGTYASLQSVPDGSGAKQEHLMLAQPTNTEQSHSSVSEPTTNQ
ncbi:hypothetical protein A4X09_0g45 [Tilletia walkeri]|uniref:Uncharacterized protein n=1 Tax=Tilletia walkeri TaxID=117179 RepID=A0A8X7T7Y8_9BASI|nr:hypothetical protein A4X09_0g45 [Tilletia walkeri]